MRRGFALFLVMLALAPAPAVAQEDADAAALTLIPSAFSAAWARGDGAALGQLMAEDVDFVTVGGSWLHGRGDFTLYHQRLFDGRFRGSTISALAVHIRRVRPDLAFVRWTWRIAGDRDFDGSARPPRVGLMSMLAEKRGGRWVVIASQNTNGGPGTAPENEGLSFPLRLPPAQP